ncbi:hypothetical protein GCM10010973_09560 [Cribrihabitans marinus]|nr:hypothetical protein GCM10010973_09560 [Cribrihabitans marinus]
MQVVIGMARPLCSRADWHSDAGCERSAGLHREHSYYVGALFKANRNGEFMTEVKSGDTVAIHYTGTLRDGQTFDSSEGRDPLAFEVGSGQIIPGLDAAMPGMEVGDKKRVEVECQEAYGPVNPEARQAVPREGIPDEIPLEIGSRLQMQSPDGQAVPVTVVEVDEATVTLDANHPLAGQDLIFDIELVSID